MFIHAVYFWLNDGLDEKGVAEFEQGLDALCTKTTAQSGYYGQPADTPDRAVVDKSYSYGLILFFEDIEAHDVYQVSDVHQGFIARNKEKWTGVKVFDTETV